MFIGVYSYRSPAYNRTLPATPFLSRTNGRIPFLGHQSYRDETQECLEALKAGELQEKRRNTWSSRRAHFHSIPLYYESFLGYVSRHNALFKKEMIRSSEVSGEQLWLLDEGHCFRDQLMRFCQLESAQSCQIAYRLGSMETFMRMVESGKGITFIPELAVLQLNDEQKRLVRPFAMPRPTRRIYIVTRTDFIRHTLLNMLIEKIKACIPKEMLTLQNGQKVV